MDTLTETLATLDHIAEAEPVSDHLIERFLLRTGRPLPRVIVLGPGIGQLARQVDTLGGDATGLGGPREVARAQAAYPAGRFLQADFRAPGLDGSIYDGAWLGALANHLPGDELVNSLRGLHRCLRPGGLIYASLAGTRGWQQTPHGRLYREGWAPQAFAAAASALDFLLVDDKDGLIFRREY